MTALLLLQQLHALGVRLTPLSDGRVHCRARKGVLTPALLDVIRQYKHELHDWVEAFEERAAIAEYCAGLPRPEAEARAWACLLDAQSHTGCAACGYPDVAGATR